MPKDLGGDTPEGQPTLDYRKEIKLKVEPAVHNGQVTLDRGQLGTIRTIRDN